MARRIVLLNHWKIWANGAIKAGVMGVASLGVAGTGNEIGLTDLRGRALLDAVVCAVLARVLQYLLTHEPPDIFVTEESVAPDGTVTTRTTAVTKPEEVTRDH